MKDLKDIYTLEDCEKGTLSDSEPLLEYVVKTSNYEWPKFGGYNEDGSPDFGLSWVPKEFLEYYLKGEIDTSMKTDYLQHEEVQNTLKVFELDHEKFWYLCLMLKDVVRGYTEDAHPKALTPREELEGLIEELMKMEPEMNQVGLIDFKKEAELTLKVKKNTYSPSFTIKNGMTLFFLRMAVRQFLEKYQEDSHLDVIRGHSLDTISGKNIGIFNNKATTGKKIWKVALFHKYMDSFLSWHLKDKTVKRKLEVERTMSNGKKRTSTLTVDTNRLHLISRLIYIMGISHNENYNNISNNRSSNCLLKNNLKGEYKNPQPRNHNSRYSSY